MQMLLKLGSADKVADFVNAELDAGRKIFGLGGGRGLRLAVVAARLCGRHFVGRGAEGLEALRGLGVLVGLEHHVGFEQFADVRLQFQGRHLQQADGLLQLRRHR